MSATKITDYVRSRALAMIQSAGLTVSAAATRCGVRSSQLREALAAAGYVYHDARMKKQEVKTFRAGGKKDCPHPGCRAIIPERDVACRVHYSVMVAGREPLRESAAFDYIGATSGVDGEA